MPFVNTSMCRFGDRLETCFLGIISLFIKEMKNGGGEIRIDPPFSYLFDFLRLLWLSQSWETDGRRIGFAIFQSFELLRSLCDGSVPFNRRSSYESSFLHRLIMVVSSSGAPIVQ